MKKLYFILFLISLLYSCQQTLNKPETLLSEREMSEILADIYLYKQTPDNMPLSPQTAFDTYVSIFKNHQVSKEVFQDNFTYYYVHSEVMKSIYNQTIENLKNKLSAHQLEKFKEEQKQQNEQ